MIPLQLNRRLPSLKNYSEIVALYTKKNYFIWNNKLPKDLVNTKQVQVLAQPIQKPQWEMLVT